MIEIRVTDTDELAELVMSLLKRGARAEVVRAGGGTHWLVKVTGF